MPGTPVNPYAAGRRRYLGGASAPNRGPVANKSGYVQRDLQKQVRQDAQRKAYQEAYRRFAK